MSTFALRDDMISGVANTPVGYGQWTDNSAVRHLDSSAGLTAGTRRLSGCPQRPSKCLIQAITQAIRWLDDPDESLNPTAAVGNVLAAGATLEYDGDLSRLRWIQAAASAEVNVTFYRS